MPANHANAVSFIKKLLGFSISSFAGLAITVISVVINTRLFSSDEMGKINLFITVGSILLFITYLGVDQSFCRYYYDRDDKKWINRLLSTCMSLSTYAFLAILLITLLFSGAISSFIGGEPSVVVSISLLVFVAAQLICRYISLIQRMSQKAVAYSMLLICMSIANKLVYSPAAFFSADYSIAVMVMAASYLAIAIAFFVVYIHIPGYRIRPVAPNDTEAQRALRFGLPLMPTSLLAWANTSIPLLVLQHQAGYSMVGVYSSAVTMASAISLVQSGFNAFWSPYVYQNYERNTSAIKQAQGVLVFVLTIVGLLLMLGLDFLYLLVGDSFQIGKSIMPILLLSPICATIAEATGIGINLLEKSYLHIIHYMVGLVVNLALALVFVPTMSIAGAALATALSAIATLIVRSYLGCRYYNSIQSYFKTGFGVFALLSCSCICCWSVNDHLVRYAAVIVSLSLCLYVYRNEAKYLLEVLSELMRGMRRKSSSKG